MEMLPSPQPFQGVDQIVADISPTNADLASTLAALSSKRWSSSTTGTTKDLSNWKTTFGANWPEVRNCRIDMISATAFTINRDGATFEVAANTPAPTITTQNLSKIFLTGTNIKVLIQF